MSIVKLVAKLNAIDSADEPILYLAFCVLASGMTSSICTKEESSTRITLMDVHKDIVIDDNIVTKSRIIEWMEILSQCGFNNIILLESMIQIILNISSAKCEDLYMATCRKQLKDKYMRKQYMAGIEFFPLEKKDKDKIVDYMIMLTTCGNNVMVRMLERLLENK